MFIFLGQFVSYYTKKKNPRLSKFSYKIDFTYIFMCPICTQQYPAAKRHSKLGPPCYLAMSAPLNHSKETSGNYFGSRDWLITSLLRGPTLRLKRQKEPVETSSSELYFLQRRKHHAQWASNTLLTTGIADTSLAAVGVIIFLFLCLSFPFLVAVHNSPFPTRSLTHIHKHPGAVPCILFPQSAIHLPIGFTLKGPCL